MRPNSDQVIVAKARAYIEATLSNDGVPSASGLAAASGFSLRTLQRRLEQGGTSYTALLEDVRREMALARLGAGCGTLGDLSAHLGYKRQSALTRAVRRWTGQPPSRLWPGNLK